jgi:HPt (histidine-containing phosphotransfer) domain-containing protein
MDITSLAEELGLEETDARRLVETFLEATEQDLLLLNRAMSDRDSERIRRTAHHIKGAASNLELSAVTAAALRIEETACSGRFEEAALQIPVIRSELHRIRAELRPGE